MSPTYCLPHIWQVLLFLFSMFCLNKYQRVERLNLLFSEEVIFLFCIIVITDAAFVITNMQIVSFSDLNISNSFWDSFKKDYKNFEGWFAKCQIERRPVYLWGTPNDIQAVMVLKKEKERIELVGKTLPEIWRLKRCMLKVSPKFKGKGLGSVAMKQSIDDFKKSDVDELYLTVYNHHTDLIKMYSLFDLKYIGRLKKTGELVYLRQKN